MISIKISRKDNEEHRNLEVRIENKEVIFSYERYSDLELFPVSEESWNSIKEFVDSQLKHSRPREKLKYPALEQSEISSSGTI